MKSEVKTSAMYKKYEGTKCFKHVKYEWHKKPELPVLELRDGSNVRRVKDRFTLHVCIDKSYLWIGDNVHMFDDIKFSTVKVLKGQRKITLTDSELTEVMDIAEATTKEATTKEATTKEATEKSVAEAV